MHFSIHGSSAGSQLFLPILFRQTYLLEFGSISTFLNYPNVYKLNSGMKTFKILKAWLIPLIGKQKKHL